MNDTWRRVELPGGRSFQARRDSPVDAAFPEHGDADVPMPWSLGMLGDLMWMRLPETRPILAEHIAREVEDAMDAGRELMMLVGSIAPDALWYPVMEPTLEAYPHTRDRVAAQLMVVWEAYHAEHPDRDATQYALEQYVFINLQYPPYRGIVEEILPDLATLLASREWM
ncbi:hypothetical protein [Amycolatopsis sp. NPDC051372]|uniref:hypothetical protein n=1 Tax=unclassified Amycolatopsis TaxID=2618356 RepID=UPI00343738A7